MRITFDIHGIVLREMMNISDPNHRRQRLTVAATLHLNGCKICRTFAYLHCKAVNIMGGNLDHDFIVRRKKKKGVIAI